MKTAAIVSIVYGALVAMGGIMGFVRKGSIASIAAGGVCGILLIASGLLMRGSSESTARAAWWAALVLAVLLLGRFGSQFAQKGEWMPAGIVALLSIFALIGLVTGRK